MPDGDDDGAPIGPSEEEEAAFLAQSEDSSSHFFDGDSWSQTEGPVSAGTQARASAGGDVTPSGPLPSLEDLRGRVAPEVLGLMEELFRAKLTRVTRVPAKALKAQQG